MTAPFPHHYQTEVEWDAGRRGIVSAPPRAEICGGPPPQFDGEERWWSPEHLLLASASLCLMTTFLALADKSQLKILGYRCQAEGVLDKTAAGLAFTAVTLRVSLRTTGADSERAGKILETAKKYCIISNSLKAPVTVESALAKVG